MGEAAGVCFLKTDSLKSISLDRQTAPPCGLEKQARPLAAGFPGKVKITRRAEPTNRTGFGCYFGPAHSLFISGAGWPIPRAMLLRKITGFVEPCRPTKAAQPPSRAAVVSRNQA
jgi:hypothetical protein